MRLFLLVFLAVSAIAQTNMPPPLPSLEGPYVRAYTEFKDSGPVSNITATVHLRAATNWFYQHTKRVHGEPVVILGLTNLIWIYEQRGELTTNPVVKFTFGTNDVEKVIEEYIARRPAFRYFRVERTNYIVITNTLDLPLYGSQGK